MKNDNYCRLQFYQNRSREKAQKYFSLQNTLIYTVILISIICSFIDEKISWFFVLSSCFLELLIMYLRNKGKEYHIKNRTVSQIILLENSLQENIVSKIVLTNYEELLADKSIMNSYRETAVNKSYYNTIEPKGKRRFAYNIAESFLYTKCLFEKYEKSKKIEMIIVSIISFISSICAFIFITGDARFLIVSPIITILVIVIYGEFDAYFDFVNVNKKISQLYSQLKSKINSGVFELVELFSLYAEYNSLTRETQPIPSSLYQKNRDSIKDMWDQEYLSFIKSFNNSFFDLNEKTIIVSQNVDRIHVEKIRLLAIIIGQVFLNEGYIYETVSIEKISSYSRSFIFNLIYSGRADTANIVVKAFTSEEEYQRAILLTRTLCEIDQNHYCNYLINEELDKNMAIAYHHANQYATNSYKSLANILVEPQWNNNKYQYYSIINSAIEFNSNILIHRKIMSLFKSNKNEVYNALLKKKPGDYIIDLSWIDDLDTSGKMKYSLEQQHQYEKGCEIGSIADLGRTRIYLLNWNDSSKAVGVVEYENKKYMVLLPIVLCYAPNSYIDIDFSTLSNIKILYTTEQYLLQHLNLRIEDRLSDTFSRVVDLINKNVEEVYMCHNDFHTNNIFVSLNDFKIIDLEDMGYCYLYTDVCRLQLSILYYLCQRDVGSNIISNFCALLNGESIHNNDIVYIYNIRHVFEASRSVLGNLLEYEQTLLLEVIFQIYYCICSNRILTGQWVELYTYLKNKVLN